MRWRSLSFCESIGNCLDIGVSTAADGLALKGVIDQVQQKLK